MPVMIPMAVPTAIEISRLISRRTIVIEDLQIVGGEAFEQRLRHHHGRRQDIGRDERRADLHRHDDGDDHDDRGALVAQLPRPRAGSDQRGIGG